MKCEQTENPVTSLDLHLGEKSTNVSTSHGNKKSDINKSGHEDCIADKTTPSPGRLSPRIGDSNNNKNIRLEKRKGVQESSTLAAATLSSSGTDKHVVSDDDYSDFNKRTHSKNTSKRKGKRVSRKKDVAALQPLEPLRLKLKTSQIHSKKYPFPHKLFDLLEKASLDNRSSDVVSWSPDGTTFVVHDHGRFAAEFLPTYFGTTQFRSFDRQLNYWDFKLVSPREVNNKSFGGKSWKHPFFQKDRRNLLNKVNRKITCGLSSLQKIQSLEKAIKEKPHSVARTTKTTTDRVINNCPKRDESESGEYTIGTIPINMDTKLRTRLRVRKNLKGVSAALGLSPKMVSPLHGNSCAESINHPVKEIIFSALDTVQQTCDGQMAALSANDQTTMAKNIEDEFLPLFPLELLDDGRSIKQLGVKRSNIAKDSAPFVDTKTTMRDYRGYDAALCPHFDVFEGNSFHDVNLTMDMGMDTNVDMGMDANMDIDAIMEKSYFF